MAMVPSAMATLIVNQLITLNPNIVGQPGAQAKLQAQWNAICTGIINHITSAAVVSSSGTGTGSAIVSTAPGTAPVTTTDTTTGTIS